jgi:hypothetical protein
VQLPDFKKSLFGPLSFHRQQPILSLRTIFIYDELLRFPMVTMPWKVDPNGDLVEDEEFESGEE